MSVKKIKPKKSERVISREVVAQVVANMEERGYQVVLTEQIERQNQFIQAVTQGLNVADPENAGRKIAVVWQDHLAMLNDVAKVVMALGLLQKEVDEAIVRKEMVSEDLNNRLIKARTVIENIANHLANEEKAAKEATKFLEVPEEAIAERLAEQAPVGD